jgi:hypothetical protein
MTFVNGKKDKGGFNLNKSNIITKEFNFNGVISKWDRLGFLEGLKGHVRDDITKLYESHASCLLNE